VVNTCLFPSEREGILFDRHSAADIQICLQVPVPVPLLSSPHLEVLRVAQGIFQPRGVSTHGMARLLRKTNIVFERPPLGHLLICSVFQGASPNTPAQALRLLHSHSSGASHPFSISPNFVRRRQAAVACGAHACKIRQRGMSSGRGRTELYSTKSWKPFSQGRKRPRRGPRLRRRLTNSALRTLVCKMEELIDDVQKFVLTALRANGQSMLVEAS
jgi:hypothetical protein